MLRQPVIGRRQFDQQSALLFVWRALGHAQQLSRALHLNADGAITRNVCDELGWTWEDLTVETR